MARKKKVEKGLEVLGKVRREKFKEVMEKFEKPSVEKIPPIPEKKGWTEGFVEGVSGPPKERWFEYEKPAPKVERRVEYPREPGSRKKIAIPVVSILVAILLIAWLGLIPGVKVPLLPKLFGEKGTQKQAEEGGAVFEYFRLIPSKTEAAATGEVVEVTADVRNTGNAKGECWAELVIEEPDGVVSKQTKVLVLAPGETKRVSFLVRIEKKGDYVLRLPDRSETTIQGKAPSPGVLRVVSLDAPSEVEAGQEVSIVVEVQNVGDMKITESVSLRVDGTVVDRKTETYAPKETRTLKFRWKAPPERKQFEIEVDGQSDTIGVTGKAIYVLKGLEVQPSPARVGEEIRVTADMMNKGNITESHKVILKVNFKEQDSKLIELGPGETQTVTFTYKASDPGLYEFEVEGTSRQVRVLKPAALKVEDLIMPKVGCVLEDISIEAKVLNEGEVENDFLVDLLIDGKVVDTKSITLGASARGTVEFVRSFEGVGPYTVEVGTCSAQITIGDFELKIQEASGWAMQGGSTGVTVTVKAIETYNKSVSLSAEFPGGINVSFSVSGGVPDPSFDSLMKMEVDKGAEVKNYTIKVKATGVGGNTKTGTYTLKVVKGLTNGKFADSAFAKTYPGWTYTEHDPSRNWKFPSSDHTGDGSFCLSVYAEPAWLSTDWHKVSWYQEIGPIPAGVKITISGWYGYYGDGELDYEEITINVLEGDSWKTVASRVQDGSHKVDTNDWYKLSGEYTTQGDVTKIEIYMAVKDYEGAGGGEECGIRFDDIVLTI